MKKISKFCIGLTKWKSETKTVVIPDDTLYTFGKKGEPYVNYYWLVEKYGHCNCYATFTYNGETATGKLLFHFKAPIEP